MILFLKRINIIIALIIIFITLGLIKFKNNLSYLKTENFNVDAVVVFLLLTFLLLVVLFMFLFLSVAVVLLLLVGSCYRTPIVNKPSWAEKTLCT